jgi:hypothetical protein
MIYIKDKKGKYLTIKEVAAEYNVPLDLIKGRWNHGVKEFEKLIQPKWGKWDES